MSRVSTRCGGCRNPCGCGRARRPPAFPAPPCNCLPTPSPFLAGSFYSPFSGSIAPFVPGIQTPNTAIVPAPTTVELISQSVAASMEQIFLFSPTPQFEASVQDFCFCTTWAGLTIGSLAEGDIAIAVGVFAMPDIVAVFGASADIGQFFFFTRGPTTQDLLLLGPIDNAPHTMRACGDTATQSFLIQFDGASQIFTPAAGAYPHLAMSAVSRSAAGLDTLTDLQMDEYCLQFLRPGVPLAPFTSPPSIPQIFTPEELEMMQNAFRQQT